MMTFKEFLVEGFEKMPKNANAHTKFTHNVQDALWEVLKGFKIPKKDVTMAIYTYDHWRNHQVDAIHSKQSHPSGMVKITPNDWVLVRFTLNMPGRKERHDDPELLFHVMPKLLEKAMQPFFETVQRSSKFELNNTDYGGRSHLYLHWNIKGPKWPT